jgi:hypothetical protein
VLVVRPASITAEIWFDGLQSCMRHAGIECRVLPPKTPSGTVNAAIEELQPNVLIAVESTTALQSLDLPFIREYKRRHGCLRLFIPVWLAHAPGGDSSRRHDAWRRSLRRNELLADAHFSIFEPEFHERFQRDREGPDTDYVTVAQACNPFTEQPLPESKRHDYFMATSLTDERLEVTYRYLRPILARYRGLWAGQHWGFGRAYIPPVEMPVHYAQSRIALSPLVGFVSNFGAELTHRVFAAAGCGAFQLTVPTAVTGRYFRSDELVQASSPAEYGKLFEHYVDRPAERNPLRCARCSALRRAHLLSPHRPARAPLTTGKAGCFSFESGHSVCHRARITAGQRCRDARCAELYRQLGDAAFEAATRRSRQSVRLLAAQPEDARVAIERVQLSRDRRRGATKTVATSRNGSQGLSAQLANVDLELRALPVVE